MLGVWFSAGIIGLADTRLSLAGAQHDASSRSDPVHSSALCIDFGIVPKTKRKADLRGVNAAQRLKLGRQLVGFGR